MLYIQELEIIYGQCGSYPMTALGSVGLGNLQGINAYVKLQA